MLPVSLAGSGSAWPSTTTLHIDNTYQCTDIYKKVLSDVKTQMCMIKDRTQCTIHREALMEDGSREGASKCICCPGIQ